MDPERVRTKGVITKVDLCGNLDKLRKVINNEVLAVPLQRGYVPVISRSTEELKVRNIWPLILVIP